MCSVTLSFIKHVIAISYLFQLAVATDRTGECQTLGTITLSSPTGYIANNRSTQRQPCTWVIEALPGQRVELTLMDFSESPARAQRSCVEYLVISERNTNENVVVCEGDPRVDRKYRSRSNVVHVRVNEQPKGRASPVHFLLKYEGLHSVSLTNRIVYLL